MRDQVINTGQHRPIVWVTSSWDDGYPLDLRLAELLDRYGIPATFYIPMRSQLPVLDTAQIRDLARSFDIGGHTVNHVRLHQVSLEASREEIIGSKQRIEDITGVPCTMFCPPGGRYLHPQLAYMRQAGYLGVRTVELMSVQRPALHHGLLFVPTTLQLYRHPASAYFKNALKRRRWTSLKTYLQFARGLDLPQAADSLLEALLESGGVLHLWGHSWELEHSRLWGVLENILKHLRAYRDRCRFVSNAALCEHFASQGSLASAQHPGAPAAIAEASQATR